MKAKILEISFPSNHEGLSSINDKINEVLEELEIPEIEKHRMAVCISEAYTNAHEHGNQEDPTKTITIRVEYNVNYFSIEIEDEGENELKENLITNAIPNRNVENTSGRGIGIIKKYADKITAEQKEKGGTCFTLYWDLNKYKENNSIIL